MFSTHKLITDCTAENIPEIVQYALRPENGVRLASLRTLTRLTNLGKNAYLMITFTQINQALEKSQTIPCISGAVIKNLRDDDQLVRKASIDALANLRKFGETVNLTKTLAN